MKANRILIFCQAPADMPYVLKLYDSHKAKDLISVFVINVEGMFRFLSALNLDLEKLEFIPYEVTNLRRISLILSERSRINLLWRTHFASIEHGTVYFFSRYEDWLTAAFIYKFTNKKGIKVKYIDHYDNSSELFPKHNSTPFRLKIYQLILKFLTNAHFKVEVREKLPEFDVDKYAIVRDKFKIDQQIFQKYSYSLNSENENSLNVLFFISPCDTTFYDSGSYDKILVTIIKIFKGLEYSVFVKGHPRLGLPESVLEFVDFEIPSYVPGEFIDTKSICLFVGLETTAICHFAMQSAIPTYSVMKLFPYVNESLFNVFINYLTQQSEGKIKFCESLDDLKKIGLLIKANWNG